MDFIGFWPIVLGIVVVLAVIAGFILVRVWPSRHLVSDSEAKEMASAPMSASQKGAWCGLLVGVATLITIIAILANTGAAEYWENDNLRMLVVAIFILGIVAHPLLSNMFHIKSRWERCIDEREDAIVSRASIVQPPAILITMAFWLVTLTREYHDQGAVPVVYLYLIFGSIVLVMMIAQSAGVLLGHFIGSRYGQS